MEFKQKLANAVILMGEQFAVNDEKENFLPPLDGFNNYLLTVQVYMVVYWLSNENESLL